MKKGNLFENIPDAIPEEIFEDIVKAEGVRIERIVSKGHSSPETGWYDQEENEWVLVLQGEAVLRFEDGDETVRLSAGMHVNIPAHVKHQVEWTAPDRETIWLAVFY